MHTKIYFSKREYTRWNYFGYVMYKRIKITHITIKHDNTEMFA